MFVGRKNFWENTEPKFKMEGMKNMNKNKAISKSFEIISEDGKVINVEETNGSLVNAPLHLMDPYKANNSLWSMEEHVIEIIPGFELFVNTIYNANGNKTDVVTYEEDNTLTIKPLASNDFSQYWNLSRITKDVEKFVIQSFDNPSQVFTIKNGQTEDGTPIVLDYNNNLTHQKWTIPPDTVSEEDIKIAHRFEKWIGAGSPQSIRIKGLYFRVNPVILEFVANYKIQISPSEEKRDIEHTILSNGRVMLSDSIEKPGQTITEGTNVKVWVEDVYNRTTLVLDKNFSSKDPISP